jgi:hypothetical protein
MAGLYYVVMALLFGLLCLGAAIVGSISFVVRAKKRLPPGLRGRGLFLGVGGFAPFVGLVWLVVALFIHVQVSDKWAHQDCGFSGDPYVTLPNGYVLGSLNTYSGYITAPGFKTDLPATGPGYVRSLIDIELTDEHFVGTYQDFGTNTVHNFSFDTRDRSIRTSDTTIPIDFETVQNRVHTDPTSYWKLYRKYRHRWPAVVFLDLIAVGGGAIIFGVRKFWAVMQGRATSAMAQ